MSHQPPPEARSLPDPPTDGITSLSYLPSKESLSLLASTSWDGALRVHDTSAMSRVLSQTMDAGPLLSLATPGNGAIFVGGLDGSVQKFDMGTSSTSLIGVHTADPGGEPKNACSCLASLDKTGNVVASAGWHSQFHVWDVRTANRPVITVELPGKAFSMDSVNDNRVVVGTSSRRNCIIDVRMSEENDPFAEIVLDRESSLKYQTRSVRFFPDGKALAVASIEGRVAVEFLEELGVKAEKKKYAFKCHRVGDTVYPVNSIAFHPRYGTFATGGCEGTVVTWDGLHKKKLASLPQFASSIAALAFNHDGSELAIASSYTFEEGERDHPRDEIFVREMLDSECKPKSSK
mmetsp:Transcript_17760/g.32132  ORF Transcript_17760/g.32132 Transcript_17760/m.32132 type:complete len:348 (-) Transcript_17760:230-1273(-)